MDLGDLTHERFAELVGETFLAHLDAGDSIELELTEAKKLSGDRPDHAFSIVFKGPPEPFLPQRLYELEHDALGRLAIFLVPIAEKKDGFLYEAVFTRLEPTP